MKSILLLTVAVSLSSFAFADHDHFLNQCRTETFQEWVEGYWTTQTVPAVYRTTQVFDPRCNRYIQKQVLVTPACTKQVFVPGRYITKTRYVCVTTPPICETNTSISFNKPLFHGSYSSNVFQNQTHFRSTFELPKPDFRFRSYDFSRKPIQRNNDFRVKSRFSQDKGFQFKFKNKRNTFSVNFD